MQELAEALTATKSMVGRRLLECSDLSQNVCLGPLCERVGFESECNEIVTGITAHWRNLKNAAENAAKAVEAELRKAKEAAEGALEELEKQATGWLNDARKDIGCVPPAVAASLRPNDLPLTQKWHPPRALIPHMWHRACDVTAISLQKLRTCTTTLKTLPITWQRS